MVTREFNSKRGKGSSVRVTITENQKEEWENFLKQNKNDKTSVRVRLDSDVKEAWREFVEKSDKFKTVSQLIRTAVNDLVSIRSSKRSLRAGQISGDFQTNFKNSLKAIDNWESYEDVRKLEELIRNFNKTVKKEPRRELVQNKLLEIQGILLKIILELSILV